MVPPLRFFASADAMRCELDAGLVACEFRESHPFTGRTIRTQVKRVFDRPCGRRSANPSLARSRIDPSHQAPPLRFIRCLARSCTVAFPGAVFRYRRLQALAAWSGESSFPSRPAALMGFNLRPSQG
jgi:hypothetical protein